MGALIAIGAWADAAVDANLGNLTAVLSKPLGITNRFDVLDAAPHRYSEAFVLCAASELWPLDRTGENKKPAAVWHLYKLRHDATGALKA